MELGCVREFIGEMHQLKDKRAILWFHAGEILARFDHNLGDADLVAILKRVTQECIGFIAAFLRLKIVWLVEEDRVDLIQIHKILNIDRLGCFDINPVKVFFFQNDIFAFFVLVTFDDLVPRNFFAVLLRNTPVIHGTEIAFSQQTKLKFFAPRRRIKSDGNINEAKADAAFPDCARHILK